MNEKPSAPPRAQQPAPIYVPPTDLVDLPSRGRFYPKGHALHNVETVEVKYMTTREEDILLNQSFLEKGIMLDKLIESILINKRIDVNTLLVGDKNAVIINARKNAYGAKYNFSYVCSKCYTENECTVDLGELDFRGQEDVELTDDGTFILRLPVSNATVEVGFLTSNDEMEISKKNQQKEKHGLTPHPTLERYRKMIKSANGNRDPLVIANLVSNMPIRDSHFLTKNYIKNNPDVDFVYKHVCVKCDNDNEGGVPLMGNFFWFDE